MASIKRESDSPWVHDDRFKKNYSEAGHTVPLGASTEFP